MARLEQDEQNRPNYLLHLFKRFDAEDIQSLLQNARGQITEKQAAGAFSRFSFEHRAILVKAREMPR